MPGVSNAAADVLTYPNGNGCMSTRPRSQKKSRYSDIGIRYTTMPAEY